MKETEQIKADALAAFRMIRCGTKKLRQTIETIKYVQPTGRKPDGSYDFDYWRDVLNDIPQLPKYHSFQTHPAVWNIYSELSRICQTCPVSVTDINDIEAAASHFSAIGGLQQHAQEQGRRIVLHYSVSLDDALNDRTGRRFGQQLMLFADHLRWSRPGKVTVIIHQEIVNIHRNGEEHVSAFNNLLEELAIEHLGAGTIVQFYAHGSTVLANNSAGEMVAPWTTRHTPGPLSASLYLPHEVHWCRSVIRQTCNRSLQWGKSTNIGAWLSLGASYRRSAAQPCGEWVWHDTPDLHSASYWGCLLSTTGSDIPTHDFISRNGPVHYVGGTEDTAPLIVLHPTPGDSRGATLEEFEQYVRASSMPQNM